MIFHILADTDHGNKEIIGKESKLIKEIISDERSNNSAFFTEIFKVNEWDLISSVLKSNDWKGDERKIYEPIINTIKKYNIKIYPLAPYSNVVGKIRNETLFTNFKRFYMSQHPQTSLIDVGEVHSEYFVEKIKEELKGKGENKIYLHILTSSILGCEDKIEIINK